MDGNCREEKATSREFPLGPLAKEQELGPGWSGTSILDEECSAYTKTQNLLAIINFSRNKRILSQ
jgi:hypothetical protein